MILGSGSEGADGPLSRATLGDLFELALERRRDAAALSDPPDREFFTEGRPRVLTYGDVDRAVSNVAARLRATGLRTDSIVATQLPNVVEHVITLLGVLRAGMIAAPLPLLWHRAEAVEALTRIGARGFIGCGRIGPIDYSEVALEIAAETFTVRAVYGFGNRADDAIVALDDVFDLEPDPMPAIERDGNPADHVAVVTFDVTSRGLMPVARTHAELIAGGLVVALEARISPNTTMLGALALSSFAGLATTLVPWLASGGTLALHHPFNAAVLTEQCSGAVAIVPGPLAARLTEAGIVGGAGAKTLLAVWRAPERLGGSAVWSGSGTMIDVLAFGELGLVPLRRDPAGRPGALKVGAIRVPNEPASVPLIDITRAPWGSIALSGAMVPELPFPPGRQDDQGGLLRTDSGAIDTGYVCRIDGDRLTIDGPPAGLVSVGGYRFVLRHVQEALLKAAAGATIAALPDGLIGHRLAGSADDRVAIRRALSALGSNPLLVEAFRERRGRAPAGIASAA